MKLSVLEQIPLFVGHDARTTLSETVALARAIEEEGFRRIWLAEHHGNTSFLSSAPDLLVMHLLDATERIHVGSGGVMAMHYGSLQIAERFSTLSTIFPGRVDLGLGRAPGGSRSASLALNQGNLVQPNEINTLILEVQAFLTSSFPDSHPYHSVTLTPRSQVPPELWLLGSSGQSAGWAGEHDFNYAYAQFFSGQQDSNILNYYRSHLPSRHNGGNTLSALCVSAADTHDEALDMALSAADFRYSMMKRRPISFKDAADMDRTLQADLKNVAQRERGIIFGTYDTVADAIRTFSESHHSEEIMLITYASSVQRKIDQFGELARRLAD